MPLFGRFNLRVIYRVRRHCEGMPDVVVGSGKK